MGKGNKNNKGKSKSKKSEKAKKQSAAGTSTSAADDALILAAASATSDQNYEITIDDLERCLYHNLRAVYDVALKRLMDLGYQKEHVQIALYMNGHVKGTSNNILSNIVANAIHFINSSTQLPKLPAMLYNDMGSRVEKELATLVKESVIQTGWNEFKVLCHLLAVDFLEEVPEPISLPEQEQLDQDQGNARTCPYFLSKEKRQRDNDFGPSGESKELTAQESNRSSLGKGDENVREEPGDDGDDQVDSVRDGIIMMKKELRDSILELEEETRRLMWSTIRDTNTYLIQCFSHNMLRERILAEMSGLKADIEAWNLRDSESKQELTRGIKTEKKANKEASLLQKQSEQVQKQKMDVQNKESELEQEQLQVNTAKKEIEVRLAQLVKAKEKNHDAVWQEERLRRITKENIKKKEKEFNRETELTIQCLTDDIRRKEDELSQLRASSQNADQEELYELFYKVEEVRRGGCVICFRNDPSCLLLPCGHKILCQNCADAEVVGKRCPDCHVEIQGRLHIFGPTS